MNPPAPAEVVVVVDAVAGAVVVVVAAGGRGNWMQKRFAPRWTLT